MKNNQHSKKKIKKSPKICILLSSYNGEEFIKEQIESIIIQLNSADRIFIRDDGSTDKTLAKIREVSDERIILDSSQRNIGFGRSFMSLIAKSPKDFDYYFLSDQDDIWLPDKISKSIKKIKHLQKPAMVCTRLKIVDTELNEIGLSPLYTKKASFRNAICQNIATGCTIALNKEALLHLQKIPIESYNDGRMYYHDWWIYLNISYFGEVIFDASPSVLYRQHNKNQIGMQSGIKRYLSMAKRVLKHPWTPIPIHQLNLFIQIHQVQIKEYDLEYIRKLCTGGAKSITLNFIKSHYPVWQKFTDSILFKTILIIDFCRKKIPRMH